MAASNLPVPVMMAQAALLDTEQSLYTVPVATNGIVKEILICNTSDSVDARVNIHFTESTGTTNVSNTILGNALVHANETKIISLSTVLNPEDMIVSSADTSGIIGVTISGVEMEIK